MAKIKEEVNLFPMKDFDDMLILFKHFGGWSDSQRNFIQDMRVKYVNKNSPRPVEGCGNCMNGWSNAFRELRDWAMSNSTKFK